MKRGIISSRLTLLQRFDRVFSKFFLSTSWLYFVAICITALYYAVSAGLAYRNAVATLLAIYGFELAALIGLSMCIIIESWAEKQPQREHRALMKSRVRGRDIVANSKACVKHTQQAPKGFLIDLLLPPDRAEDALFNILGRYDYWVAKHGFRKARLIFLMQSIFVVVTYWSDWLLKRLKLLDLFRPS